MPPFVCRRASGDRQAPVCRGPHIIFVLAVHRPELAHSIKALYGGGFDAEGYLGRFFDVDFVLPEPERKAFIEDRLSAIQIDDYLGRTKDQYARQEFPTAYNLLCGFFGASDLSLRRIAQAIHRLGLVLASLRSDKRAFTRQAVVALILRTINADFYHRFVRGEISDLDVVNMVFARPKAKALHQTEEGRWFEATLIAAALEKSDYDYQREAPPSTPLLDRYQSQARSPAPDYLAPTHGADVIGMVESFKHDLMNLGQRRMIAFGESVKRLELFSEGLKDEASQ